MSNIVINTKGATPLGATPPAWTAEKPTKTGTYWFHGWPRPGDQGEACTSFVVVSLTAGTMLAHVEGLILSPAGMRGAWMPCVIPNPPELK